MGRISMPSYVNKITPTLNSINLSKEMEVLPGVDAQTKKVHMVHTLPMWLAQKLHEQCPQLKTVQLSPREYERCGPKNCALQFLRDKGIAIKKGHVSKRHIWRSKTRRSATYEKDLHRFHHFSEDQAQRFGQLLLCNIREAEMVAMYFRLNDELYISQRMVGEHFGLSRGYAIDAVSRAIGCVKLDLFGDSSAKKVIDQHKCMLRRFEKAQASQLLEVCIEDTGYSFVTA